MRFGKRNWVLAVLLYGLIFSQEEWVCLSWVLHGGHWAVDVPAGEVWPPLTRETQELDLMEKAKVKGQQVEFPEGKYQYPWVNQV